MCTKDTIQRVERLSAGWEEVFANHVSGKDIKNSYNSIAKNKSNNLIKKWVKGLN